MRHIAAAILAAHVLDGDAGRRQEEAFRELHRRPDALPDPIEPVRASRRFRVSGFTVRRRGSLPSEG